jgi:hypothetical protein
VVQPARQRDLDDVGRGRRGLGRGRVAVVGGGRVGLDRFGVDGLELLQRGFGLAVVEGAVGEPVFVLDGFLRVCGRDDGERLNDKRRREDERHGG